jgi:hypothetical protein
VGCIAPVATFAPAATVANAIRLQGIDEATERHRYAERQLRAMQETVDELARTKANKADAITAVAVSAELQEVQGRTAEAVQVRGRNMHACV